MSPILLALLVIAILFVVIIAGRPDEFRVTRSATILATSEVVFARVNELRKWEDWSPWAMLDPNSKSTFEGPSSGIGSVMSWAGNKKVGEGRMTVIESRPSDLIRIKLEFLKPFKSTSTSEFVFKFVGNQTEVIWSMSGRNSFFSKIFCLFMNMDKMIGKDFEKGLANLKRVGEAPLSK